MSNSHFLTIGELYFVKSISIKNHVTAICGLIPLITCSYFIKIDPNFPVVYLGIHKSGYFNKILFGNKFPTKIL